MNNPSNNTTSMELTTTQIAKSDVEQAWEIEQRRAMALSKSTIIPKDYVGNVGNCLIALDMAKRTGAPALMVMQNLYIVHGRPSWSSAFLVACINASGRFSALRYEERGTMGQADYAIRAVATEHSTGEVLTGSWITAAMVKGEGWDSKAGSKWKTMPEQMYRYRAAAFWARAYAPEIAVGLHTADEVEDMAPRPMETTIRWSPAQMELAKAEIAAGKATVEEIAERWPNLAPDQIEELKAAAK